MAAPGGKLWTGTHSGVDRGQAVLTLSVAGAVVVVLLLSVVVAYNGLVRRRNQVDNAWAQVDVQLRRRYDLIPNLVATVQGYAAHERGALEAVARARAQAMNAGGTAELAHAEQALTGALRGLFAVVESYPQLKANENFIQLQQELANTEDRTAYARQYYNDSVLSYNNAIGTFPRNLVAATTGFRSRDYFRVEGADAGPVTVRF
jgi:LemA protein